MNKQFFPLIALLALTLAFSCQKEESALAPVDQTIEERSGNPNARVFPPTARPYGKSQAEWAQDWWTHMWSFGCGNFPLFPDSDAYQASLNTDGPVIFLPGTFSSEDPVSRSITVPHGKALMFPLVNTVWIYSACYESPAEDEALANGTLVEYITSIFDPILSGPGVSISATLDGVAFNNLRNYRFTSSGLYGFDVNDELADCLGDACLSADDLLGFADGYWLTLKPLSRGQHTLNFRGDIPEVGLSVNVTYHITVE